VERPSGYLNEYQAGLIGDFILCLRDLRDKGLSDNELTIVQHRHDTIAEACIDAGLVEDICNLRDRWKEYFKEV